MNLCTFGIHDWEYLDVSYFVIPQVFKRVCLRCGKKQDTMTQHEKDCEAAEQLTMDRTKKAIELWYGKEDTCH